MKNNLVKNKSLFLLLFLKNNKLLLVLIWDFSILQEFRYFSFIWYASQTRILLFISSAKAAWSIYTHGKLVFCLSDTNFAHLIVYIFTFDTSIEAKSILKYKSCTKFKINLKNMIIICKISSEKVKTVHPVLSCKITFTYKPKILS